MRVRDVMEPAIATVEATAPLEGVADLMRARHCHALPVVDHGAFAGVITAPDVLLTLTAPPAVAATTPAQVMRSMPLHEHAMIGRDASLSAAAERMAELHVESLAVVVDGQVVGMVRMIDMLPALTHHQRPTTRARHLGRAMADGVRTGFRWAVAHLPGAHDGVSQGSPRNA